MPFDILVINPGSTSTKIAVFRDDELTFHKTVEHSADDLSEFPNLLDQLPYRKKLIRDALGQAGIDASSFDAVVGRGGMLARIPGGTYEVDASMIGSVREARHGEHASNLGCILADEFAASAGCKAYIVDAVSTYELAPEARLSGIPELERSSMFHALNHKAVARQVAAEMGMKYEDARFIVAHLGTGTSVGAHIGGRVVDVFDPMNDGAFSVDRTGGLPSLFLMNMCYSGKYTHREMKRKINGEGGLYAYVGTKDLREAWKAATGGDESADIALRAMAWQVAKDVGAMAAVCCGKVDCIIFTGGMAHSSSLMELIVERVSFIAPVRILPGEEEMRSLAMGALRVLRGEETAKSYAEADPGINFIL